MDTDQKYLQADSGANRDDGCTAVTAVLVGQNLIVANVGDSRAVLSKGGQGEHSSRQDCHQTLESSCMVMYSVPLLSVGHNVWS